MEGESSHQADSLSACDRNVAELARDAIIKPEATDYRIAKQQITLLEVLSGKAMRLLRGARLSVEC